MFPQVSVILFGGGYLWYHVLSQGISGTRSLLGMGMSKGLRMSEGALSRGIAIFRRVSTHPRGHGTLEGGYPTLPPWTRDTMGYGQQAGGSHPTGMLSNSDNSLTELNKCYIILICDRAWNLTTIKKLCLSYVWDSSQTSMHSKIIYNSMYSHMLIHYDRPNFPSKFCAIQKL